METFKEKLLAELASIGYSMSNGQLIRAPRVAGWHKLPAIVFDEPKALELGRKCCAELMLLETPDWFVTPSQDEWIGINLLERDDEL
jgi:hypothetical protein